MASHARSTDGYPFEIVTLYLLKSHLCIVWLLFSLPVHPFVGLEGEQQWTEHTVLGGTTNAQCGGGGLASDCTDHF